MSKEVKKPKTRTKKSERIACIPAMSVAVRWFAQRLVKVLSSAAIK